MVSVQIKEEKPEIEICSLEAEVGAPERNGLKKVKKESKPGIIYLSTVPPKMNVLQIREYFSAFGPINRSFMQPDKSKCCRDMLHQIRTNIQPIFDQISVTNDKCLTNLIDYLQKLNIREKAGQKIKYLQKDGSNSLNVDMPRKLHPC